MFLRQPCIYAVLSLLFVACGGSDDPAPRPDSAPEPEPATITIVDHADTLTTAADENLFIITVDTIDTIYPFSEIAVAAQAPDAPSYRMQSEPMDTNSDGNLDPGESLLVTESLSNNRFDESHSGQEVIVRLHQNEFNLLATEIWTP